MNAFKIFLLVLHQQFRFPGVFPIAVNSEIVNFVDKW